MDPRLAACISRDAIVDYLKNELNSQLKEREMIAHQIFQLNEKMDKLNIEIDELEKEIIELKSRLY